MINYKNPFNISHNEEQSLSALKSVAACLEKEFLPELHARLSEEEIASQRYVSDLSFEEGTWYRPIHNVLVPLAMLAIIEGESLPRDLVFAAQLHDIGYTKLKIEGTLEGAKWQGVDARIGHMLAGAEMAKEYLSGRGFLSDKRIKTLVAMIAEHDNPYIGKTFQVAESYFLRDADRVFVPSAVSWYKDFLAYRNDDSLKVKLGGQELDFDFFVKKRISGFYETANELPDGWDSNLFPLDTALSSLSESGLEKTSTAAGAGMISQLFVHRASEVKELSDGQVVNIEEFFYEAGRRDLNFLLSL